MRLHSVTVTGIGTGAYRSALGLAIVSICMLVWFSLGVGIIGKDGDRANLMYFGVILVGVIGTIAARFRALGMARALVAMAVAQTSVAAIALIQGLGLPWSGPAEIILLNAFFVALFLGSAWLFHRAARRESRRPTQLEGKPPKHRSKL